jgi:L-lactate dehydrogenase complex protein LldG
VSSRAAILADIRRQLPVDAPLPALDGPWIQYSNPLAQFVEVLASVGGKGLVVEGETALSAEVNRIATSNNAQRIFSAVPAVPGNVAWESIDDPQDVADVDLAIASGELAVAENAAVWVTDQSLPQRSAYFLAQHLVLVVPRERLVHNMHEAYAWLAEQTGGRAFPDPLFGAFLSGPSKTADIEQSLVIGAHGARSLHVLLT